MNNDLDPAGVGKSLELFPEQIKTCFKQAMEGDIPKCEFDSVLISGMGGSSNAGKIIESLVQADSKFAFVVHNDYGLPGWVNEKTLAVGNSYSGNTEETLSALEEAKKRGSMILGITTGGQIGEMVRSREIKGVVVNPETTNPAKFPKTGLGVSLGALIGTLIKAGVLNITETEINSALDELVEIRSKWNVVEMAKWLNGYLPVLLGGRPLIGALNAGRNAMCEISRNFTQFYDFPEMNHVLIEATQKPEVAKKMKYLFFVSKFNHLRVLTRYKVTAQVFTEQGLTFDNYTLKGSTKLVQALELAHYCAWVGFHLSLLQNTDPGPEPWIEKLKASLSQVAH